MDNRQNDDFDELEPRTTPHPAALNPFQYMNGPSVPEVSLIFANNSETTQRFTKIHGAPEERGKAYANWKKDGFPSVIDPGSFNQSLTKRSNNCESPVQKNLSNNSTNLNPETRHAINNDDLSANSVPIQYKHNQTIEVHKEFYVAASRTNEIENIHLYNNQHPSHNENPIFSYSRKESVQSPIENNSYDGIKSILKNSPSNKNHVTNQKISDHRSNNDCLYQRKTSSQPIVHCESPRMFDDSHCSRRSPRPRCQHNHEKSNDERDTVRDLLRLVKNQNEQIKSLQTQVERLLKNHEHSMGYHENCNSNNEKSCEKSQSPICHRKNDQITKNKMVSPEKISASRGINDNHEIPVRYQNEQLRHAIVEKKVSIGVMTSFEFTVQNNPFVPDTDHQMNAMIRETGKSINENGDGWRANIHGGRKIPVGPLENINEDSESHPSSIYRQSSNNTQLSSQSSAKLSSNLIGKIHDNQICNENLNGHSRIPQISQSNSRPNSPVIFFNEPTPSSDRPRTFSSRKDKQNRPLSSFDREKRNKDNDEVSNEAQEKQNYSYPVDNDNVEIPRNYGRLGTEKVSMRPDNTAEGSFVLSSSDLRVSDQSPPSPDPSIHVEMREYSSEDDNEKSKHSPAVGWTFYKNVVGQVNRILHTIPDTHDERENEKIKSPALQQEINANEDILDSVKNATLERLKMLGISYGEHSEFNGGLGQKKVTFDSTYRPPLDYQTAIAQTTNSVAESNTSMHMRALALKYLSDEQLADLAVHTQGTSVRHKFLSSVHGTNMSMATMNYLKRYCLVSGTNSFHTEVPGHMNAMRPKKLKQVMMTKEIVAQSTRHQNLENSSNKGMSDNILDITTLKQQPKLL